MAWLPSIGWPELLMVLVVALVIFGGTRLPETGRALGRAIRGFKDALAEGSPNEPESSDP